MIKIVIGKKSKIKNYFEQMRFRRTIKKIKKMWKNNESAIDKGYFYGEYIKFAGIDMGKELANKDNR